MSAALHLLRRLLDQAGGATESGYILVIDSEGLEDLPPRIHTAQGEYSVHRVTTELGLRHLLWKARGAPLIAVLPVELTKRIHLAPDLVRRARNQRVHALSVNDVLEVVLGVRVVGAETPSMQELALHHVEQLAELMSRRTLPTVVDRRLLTEMLVDVSVGSEVRTEAPARILATWLQSPPDWPLNVRVLVGDALPALHGDEGRLLAWTLEDPGGRLRDLAVHGALLTVDEPDLPKTAWGPLWKASTEPPLDMDRRILRRTVTRLVEDALGHLGEAAGPLLERADSLAREHLSSSLVQTSRVLPLAFADRSRALATRAAKGQPITAEDVAWLSSHRAARLHAAEVAVLEAMGRLSRMLDRPAVLDGDVVWQVREYQRHGAFADLAVAQLRRALSGCALHHAEAGSLLELVRERRDRENRRFAETLAAGYEPALHREGLTPLHRLWRRVVLPVWESEPRARLFVVVLDGCSYPVFLELLMALAQDPAFPLGLRADADGGVAGLPALAPLPTVTSHARGALFLGELPRDPLVAETLFREQDEPRTDKARFTQNAFLGARPRRLFLKSDLADGGQALLAALADDGLDVVAAVFNAVDDQIGSSNTGAAFRLAPEDITAFKPALRAAIRAGRRVLVTADHGHSPFISTGLRAGTGTSARFTVMEKHEAPPEGFLEIDLAGLGGPPARRAFAWRSGAYLGSPQVGFHGGCALEEVVVPLAWLERDGLPADEPAWWYGAGAPQVPVRATMPVAPPFVTPVASDEPEPTPRKARRASADEGQLSFFEPAQRADVLDLPADLLATLGKDERAALVLLHDNGSARTSELAGRLGKTPMRMNGLMRSLRRTLHEAGMVLFTAEPLPDGETQYVYGREGVR